MMLAVTTSLGVIQIILRPQSGNLAFSTNDAEVSSKQPFSSFSSIKKKKKVKCVTFPLVSVVAIDISESIKLCWLSLYLRNH